jgi:hypothetical protein
MQALSSVLLLLSAFSSEALTAKTTRNAINGSAPYFTFDGGYTRATNSDELLSITLPDGTRIMPSTNPSNVSTPIVLQRNNVRFSDIGMFMPANMSSVSLSKLIDSPYNYWGDDDGDGQGRDGIRATGWLILSITDKEGYPVDRQNTLDICKAPYKVMLETFGGTLSTRYGFPKSRNFSASIARYYISPKASPKVCSARPNLSIGIYKYAGPANIWNPDKGFLVQSTLASDYHRNFPTTGANNLYFDLLVAGVNANQLTWSPVTHSGITASMAPNSSTSVRVKLTGPVATPAQRDSSSPGNIPRPSLPATFELVGRDNSGRAVIIYGFELKQWFVNRGERRDSVYGQISWCNSIGYLMPRVRDLTNAACTGDHSGSGCQSSVGASPSASHNGYMRHIDAGFFSEWGYMNGYTDASFSYFYYWTSDAVGSNQFNVYSGYGDIDGSSPHSNSYYGVCASALRP